MKRILLVEDDDYFREAVVDLLSENYKVFQANNGKSAKEILFLNDIDVVLSDIQMPQMTGLELLEWSLKEKPVPFVIMTGFSMVLETKNAFDLGAKGFIAKPFKRIELISTLESVLSEKDLTKNTQSANECKINSDNNNIIYENIYCKVSIDEFVAKPKIDFDVYVKLSPTKTIKIAHKGQEIPRDKVEHYKSKGLKHLYIHKDDFKKLVKFNLGIAEIIKNKPEISQEKKMNFIKYTGEVILENTFIDSISKESYSEAKQYVDLALDIVSDSEETVDLLNLLSSHSDQIYAHSLGVSMYSVLVAKYLGLESDLTLSKLAMAGLFHDIGKKEIDKDVIAKPRHLLTSEDRKLIESHVLRGQEILSSIPSIPTDIVQLVLEHHEDQEGIGYPFRTNKKDQHPLSKILQSTNIFLGLIIPQENGSKKSIDEAIEYIKRNYASRVDEQCLLAIQEVLKK